MRLRSKVLVVVGAAGLALSCVLAVLDLLREPCERRLTRWLPVVIGWVSDSAGNRLGERLWVQWYRSDVYAYRTPEPYAVEVDVWQWGDEWREVQGGVQAAIPTLQVSVVSRPYWEATDDQFLEVLERANPSIERLGDGSRRQAPAFLLFQEGGGVEGLQLQVLVLPNGHAHVWQIEYWGDRPEKLPEPAVRSLPPEVVKDLFNLARAAGLPAESRVGWRCFTLDGLAQTVILSENGQVGRLGVCNWVVLPASLLELRERLLKAVGVERPYSGPPWAAVTL